MGILKDRIIAQNPTFIMLLGMCPSLAVTSQAINGLGMGLATTFVLICSNCIIALLKNIIPKEVRLPSYIVIIAGFVTLVSMLLRVIYEPLYSSLGVFLDLITVNCIIFARAEVFASKNSVGASFLDGLGCGLGFTGALLIIGSIRELLGAGSIFGIELFTENEIIQPMTIFSLPAGGFFTLGIIIAIVGKLTKQKPKEIGCDNCVMQCGKEKTSNLEVTANE